MAKWTCHLQQDGTLGKKPQQGRGSCYARNCVPLKVICGNSNPQYVFGERDSDEVIKEE